jgi:hypothetical protein
MVSGYALTFDPALVPATWLGLGLGVWMLRALVTRLLASAPVR